MKQISALPVHFGSETHLKARPEAHKPGSKTRQKQAGSRPSHLLNLEPKWLRCQQAGRSQYPRPEPAYLRRSKEIRSIRLGMAVSVRINGVQEKTERDSPGPLAASAWRLIWLNLAQVWRQKASVCQSGLFWGWILLHAAQHLLHLA